MLGANITGNVFGGGNLADVTLITNVNICAQDDDDDTEYAAVAEGTEHVTINGSVYGGGKGRADNFECDKAMVGTNDHGEDTDEGNTDVRIGNLPADGAQSEGRTPDNRQGQNCLRGHEGHEAVSLPGKSEKGFCSGCDLNDTPITH